MEQGFGVGSNGAFNRDTYRDTRSRYRVERKSEYQQQKVNELFQKSKGSLVYLG